MLAAAIVMGAGCASPPRAEGPLAAGQDIFEARCASCHGRSGQGGVGPKLADGAVARRYPDPKDHAEVVRNGRGGMPPFGERLSEAEIEAVVRYEREGL